MKYLETFLEEQDNGLFNIKCDSSDEEITYDGLYYQQIEDKGEGKFVINITETEISVHLK